MRSSTPALVVALLWAAVPLDAAPGRTDWERFRAGYPYHIQIIALGEADSGGRTLIIAEPPPAVTLAALRQGWPSEFKEAAIRKHRIGVDGWVADIVTRIPARSGDATQELVQQLTRYLFGASYKSYALPIGAPVPAPGDNLDVAVSTAQLSAWFGLRRPRPPTVSRVVSAVCWTAAAIGTLVVLGTRRLPWAILTGACAGALFLHASLDHRPPPDVRFVERHAIGPPQTMEEVLNAGGGVYDSERRGLVLFVVPRSASLDSHQAALREFVLDTDLVIGAVGTNRTTAIVGRERVTPVSVMPPLRVETLLQLASMTSGDLVLRASLQDTEFGSLLDITAGLLETWPPHGVARAGFHNAELPDDVRATNLSTEADASTVACRWTTKGAGYSDAISGFTLLAFVRTGSLPVDCPAGDAAPLPALEDIAYEHYATSRDPNLARVVQYAGAYQIFQAFDIGATNPYAAAGTAAGARAWIHTPPEAADVIAWPRRGHAAGRDAAVRQPLVGAAWLGPVGQVLKAGDTVGAERGLGMHAGVRVSPRTWWHRHGIPPAHAAKLQALERPAVLGMIVERGEAGILMSVEGDTSTTVAPDTASAIDAFVARTWQRGAGAPAVDVSFLNFEAGQAREFLRSGELHAPRGVRVPLTVRD